MTQHDKFCLALSHPSSWEPEMCICDALNQARSDEREKAAERVAEIVKTTMLSWPEQVVLAARGEGAYTMEAIVASRGEAS